MPTINVSMPKSLIEKIKRDIKGKSRNHKIIQCIEKGYKFLMEAKERRESL